MEKQFSFLRFEDLIRFYRRVCKNISQEHFYQYFSLDQIQLEFEFSIIKKLTNSFQLIFASIQKHNFQLKK